MPADVLLCLLIASALATEYLHRKFYNAQAIAFAAAGLAPAAWSGGRPGFAAASIGAGAGLAATLPLFALGWIGGGDAKLAFALGACVAFPRIAGVLLWTAMAGGVIAFLVSAWSGRLGETLRRVSGVLMFWARFSRLPPAEGPRIPLVPAFLLGVVLEKLLPLPQLP